jgi:hypothetical protein
MSRTTPDKIRNLQRKLYCLAKTVTCRGVAPQFEALEHLLVRVRSAWLQ